MNFRIKVMIKVGVMDFREQKQSFRRKKLVDDIPIVFTKLSWLKKWGQGSEGASTKKR